MSVEILRRPEYLWMAKEIAKPGSRFLQASRFEEEFWRFRVYRLWSIILEEKSKELKQQLDKFVENLNSKTKNLSHEILIQYLLEKAAFKLDYFEPNEASKAIEEALKLAGLDVVLDGALGKRTRFQQKSTAQLKLSIQTNEQNNSSNGQITDILDLPPNCHNTDDTLLEKVEFDDRNLSMKDLSELQLACLLALGLFKHNTILNNELDREESFVFIEEVISQPKLWSIQIRALIERSLMEKQYSRKVERACSQMEPITKILDGIEGKSVSFEQKQARLKFLLSTSPMPFWSVKALHANILKSLGCISEALLIFESLGMWDEVVYCYKSLQQEEKAETLVRNLLAEKQHPNYYCILGDITRNPEYYEKAIEISNNRSARASTSMGKLFIARKKFDLALIHFKRSVELQPFQLGVWFNLGYCAMKENDFREGIRAFHRCVSLEPDHFEAWNNLAACYVNTQQKERAQKVLKECLKLSYENWNVWENYMLISVDIGDLSQSVRALEKLLELDTKKSIDEQILEILLKKVLEPEAQQNDHQEVENPEEIKKKLMEIMARISARQSLNFKTMRFYAELKRPRPESVDLVAWDKYVQLLERAFQRESNSQVNSKDEDYYAKSLENTIELLSVLRIIWNLKQFDEAKQKAQIKLRTRPILSVIEKAFDGKSISNDRLKEAINKIKSF